MCKPCVRCGATDRTKRGDCRVCAKAYKAAWVKANRDRHNARNNAWTAANKEKVRASSKRYHAAHPEKYKAKSAAWAKANPEKMKALKAAWLKANVDRAKAKARVWAKANIDKLRANSAAWHARNPDVRRLATQNRRARSKENGGRLSKGIRAKLLTLQRGMCPCCRKPIGDDYHLDHVMPLVLKGTNTDDNVQLLCAPCNLSKGAKHPIDFMQERGFLL